MVNNAMIPGDALFKKYIFVELCSFSKKVVKVVGQVCPFDVKSLPLDGQDRALPQTLQALGVIPLAHPWSRIHR